MVDGWITAVVLIFGIAVALIGVFAYLRMFNRSETHHSSLDIPPPIPPKSAPVEDAGAAVEPPGDK
ncbi:hypothetical protein SAMN05216378_4198 [Paenibacillus catalpae]|uniref:Uncharacterized protein n=1 Tax=Paenibacillus catalpae TaxID=1045775 RepID=A0A1I2DPG3_9BACL|nr:hypothetical protein [Paenibacillus catalpae]SFE82221.1 hypothetical protein SAMN05216378_4198 [Paenibacillus catalpae]